MNREERRIFERKLIAAGYSKQAAANCVKIVNSKSGTSTDAQEIKDGDKITLNVEAIVKRDRYEYMNQNYKAFVESSKDVVFTAHVEGKNIISCVEDPRWFFWSGDLILVERSKQDEV